MGLTQTKLHWNVLAQNWQGCTRRIEKSKGAEARTFNPYGDLPLHLACYDGQAPPEIILALINAYPESVHKINKMGRDPLFLAAKNYRIGHPYRTEVLALLRWHRPGAPPEAPINEQSLPGFFSHEPPEHFFSTSALCVVCMEEPANVAMIPCGHVCLCTTCVRTAMCKGRCPVARCEVQGVYHLQGEQVKIHQSMCGGAEGSCGGIQCGTEIAC
jgi:hypothetical protein